jgi:signal transduction histidine kinase
VPAILTARGRAAALDVLAGRLPFRLELDIAQVQLLPAVEASVYFFCSEALTNVTKHAVEAARATTVVADGHLTIEVRDDCIGGAGTHAGGELDGTLELTSPPSRGTTLKACLPLTL